MSPDSILALVTQLGGLGFMAWYSLKRLDALAASIQEQQIELVRETATMTAAMLAMQGDLHEVLRRRAD